MDTTGTRPAEPHREARPHLPDRRQRVRHKVHTPAYAGWDGSSGSRALDLSEILNISEDGVLIQAPCVLEINRALDLCLDLSETPAQIRAAGRVIWSDRSGRTGIRFPEMPEAPRRALKEWLFLNTVIGCAERSAAQVSQSEPEVARKQDDESRVAPDYTSMLAGLAAVKLEVEGLGRDVNASLQLIAERALTFTRATGAAIALAQGTEMVCLASAGSQAPPIGAQLSVESGFSGECVRTGKLLHCEDSETDSRADREACRLLGIRSMIAAPIRDEGRVIGLLEAFSPKAGCFGGDDTVLERLAEIVLIPVKRERAASARADLLETSRALREESVSERLAEIGAGYEASRPVGFRKTILIAVVPALAAVTLWLAAPWVKDRVGRRQQATSQPRSGSQVHSLQASRPVSSDLNNMESLRRLADQGDAVAQFDLGLRYATGEDVKQDYSEAARWFSLAAEQGHVRAQSSLGGCYWAGRGVPQDLGRAYFWSALARANGDDASRDRVALLTPLMTRAQVLAAQQEANNWLQHHQSNSTNSATAQ